MLMLMLIIFIHPLSGERLLAEVIRQDGNLLTVQQLRGKLHQFDAGLVKWWMVGRG
jgi:hypothetical protein